jgi:peptidylprolyl isomerase
MNSDMMQLLRKGIPVFVVLAGCALLVGAVAWYLGGERDGQAMQNTPPSAEEESSPVVPSPLSPEEQAAYRATISNPANPIAVIVTNHGEIEIELYEDVMPITAGNFRKLAEAGFYDGTKFHRVIEGFVIQGGDPLTKTGEVLRYGTGGPGYTIPDEHIRDERLTNTRGSLAMANSGPNSGGSQFFINLADNTQLDFDKPPLSSQHPVFGRVVGGMSVVDAIARVETNLTDIPLEDVVVERVVIRAP